MYQSFLNIIVKNRTIDIVFWLILIFILFKFVLHAMNTLPFSPDSWAYWELSKTIFSGDFYKIHGWRQFQTTEAYSMSFPPLWPLLILIFDFFSSFGPASMPLLAGVVFLIGVIILEITFKQQFNIKYLGLLGGYVLLSYSPFVSEITAGRSIPLAFFIISGILYIWFKPLKYSNAFILGIFAGLLILTRFDMLPFVVLFGIAIFIKQYISNSRKESLKYIFTFYYITVLIVSPYIFYSIVHFNRVFATDNALVAKSAYEIYVTDYFINPIPTVFDEPIQWFQRIFGNFFKLISVLKYIIAIAFMGIVMLFFLFRSKKINTEISLLVIFLFVYAMSLSSYILTGYFDLRYFSILISLIAILNVLSLYKLTQNFRGVSLLIPTIVIVFGLKLVLNSNINSSEISFKQMTENEKIVQEKLDKIPLCIKQLSKNDKIMFPKTSIALLVSSVFNINTTTTPKNFTTLSISEKQMFLSQFQIKAYYGDDIKHLDDINKLSFEVCKYDNNFLYLKDKN